jgi:hypothetical protein
VKGREGLHLRFRQVTVSLGLVLVYGLVAPVLTAEDQAEIPIVMKYLDATLAQQEALRGAEMEVDIDAAIPKLKKHATLRALRQISRLGQITYKALGFSGDSTVRKEVIVRYLAAESEGRENGTIAINPANYKFKYKGTLDMDGRQLQVLQLTPKKKIVGLFKGELWIDSDTGMPLRESGQFVKNPSVFLKKIAFVRDYELRDGIAVPKRIESTVETRIIGRAEIQISFSNFAKPDQEMLEIHAASAEAAPDATPSSLTQPVAR